MFNCTDKRVRIGSRFWRSAFLVTLLAVSPAMRADSIVLDFEGFADSTVLTDQYSGVTFSNAMILTAGISLNEFEFPPYSGTNVVSDNGGPMSLSFATPITTFGGYFTYAEPLTIDAFNSASSLVASTASLFSNNEAISGDPGSSPNEFLTVSFASGISTLAITGDPSGGSFALDNATLTTGTAIAPEPEGELLTTVGAGIILGLLGLSRRRRS